MTSLRRRLTLHLLATLLSLSAAAGGSLYFYVRARLTAEFDAGLAAKARVVAGIFQFDARDGLEYNPTPEELNEFRATHHPSYFEVWTSGGTVIARSPSLGNHDLLPITFSGRGGVASAKMPDGRIGRIACERITPRVEEDDGPVRPEKVPTLLVCVAQEPRELYETLRVLASALLVGVIVVAGGGALAVTLTVRRGLLPLNRLGEEADAIEASSLDHQFSEASLLAELHPIAARLNALLSRLADAFVRERRFTADVAHELRTPVAELRALAEVALKWPQDARPQQNYQDTLDIACQMEALITRLLSIARCEAGAAAVRFETLDVCRLVHDTFDSHAQAAQARQLQVSWALPVSLFVQSDRAMLIALLSNLISNAVAYTPRGGIFHLEAANQDAAFSLHLLNSTDSLVAADLPHLFEPFWRKDPARSGGTRCGLGLALVAAYAKALEIAIVAELPSPGVFQIRITFKPLGSAELQQPERAISAMKASSEGSSVAAAGERL